MTETLQGDGPGPIKDVLEGMPVFDSTGEEIGAVAELKMGDPEAATGAGQQTSEHVTPVGEFARSIDAESDLPAQVAERLIRVGYVKVSKGMVAYDVYIAADQIAEVADGAVHLNVVHEDLAAV